MKHRELIEELSKLQTSHYGCGSVYCGTCGGLVLAMRRNMTAELRSEIDDALSEMSVSDFKDAGDWGEFFQEINPAGVISIFDREEKRLNPSDIRELDRYLYDARKLMGQEPTYQKLLEHGINIAIETSDGSLIETVSIILGENILKHEELLSLALKKAEWDEDMHRVLYNFLREKVPEVRGYVGNGGTSLAW
jgi:hypothetical protein